MVDEGLKRSRHLLEDLRAGPLPSPLSVDVVMGKSLRASHTGLRALSEIACPDKELPPWRVLVQGLGSDRVQGCVSLTKTPPLDLGGVLVPRALRWSWRGSGGLVSEVLCPGPSGGLVGGGGISYT